MNYSYTESDKSHFPWLPLTSIEQLEVITLESNNQPIVIFKHSTRCSISKKVLANFEKEWDFPQNVANFYYLDLLSYREVSNAIAERFGITHQSPQLLLIDGAEVVYHASHADIDAAEVYSKIEKK